MGWVVVVKGVAVRGLAPGEDTAAAVCGLCSLSALTHSCAPWVVLDGTIMESLLLPRKRYEDAVGNQNTLQTFCSGAGFP